MRQSNQLTVGDRNEDLFVNSLVEFTKALKMKLQQDFLGCANRIRSEYSAFDEKVANLLEHWQDATAAEFHHLHLQALSDKLRRLMITLQQAGELSSKCSKMLSEEDH